MLGEAQTLKSAPNILFTVEHIDGAFWGNCQNHTKRHLQFRIFYELNMQSQCFSVNIWNSCLPYLVAGHRTPKIL